MKKNIPACLIICLFAIYSTAVSHAQDKTDTSLTPHYTVNGDGTVTDTKTGLMWKQCPEGISGKDCATGKADKFKWQYALDKAKAINDGEGYAGHKDWRVPTIEELMSIINTNVKDPTIDSAAFPNTPFDAIYWSSTLTDDSQNVACAGFSIGKRLWTFKFDMAYLRLVRGGENKENKAPEADKKKEGKKAVEKK